jgi:hypothetical protein
VADAEAMVETGVGAVGADEAVTAAAVVVVAEVVVVTNYYRSKSTCGSVWWPGALRSNPGNRVLLRTAPEVKYVFSTSQPAGVILDRISPVHILSYIQETGPEIQIR